MKEVGRDSLVVRTKLTADVVVAISEVVIDVLGCDGSLSLSAGVVSVEARSGTGIRSICRRADR
jgi:hypothetical protein